MIRVGFKPNSESYFNQSNFQIFSAKVIVKYFKVDPLLIIVSQKKIQRKYPKHFKKIADRLKAERGYICADCGMQCLQPTDSREEMSLSEIAKHTANVHHLNGNGFDNRPGNLVVLCTTHHLLRHRGRKSNPPRGQGQLFDLTKIK